MNIFDFLYNDSAPPMTVTFEQYVGNQLVQSQQMQGSPFMLQAQFQQAMQQVAQLKGRQAIKIRMVRVDQVWNQFDQKMLNVENYIEFKNWED